MADAKITGTITIGDATAPSVTKYIDATASSIGIGGSFTKRWATTPTTVTDTLLAVGSGKVIDTGKVFKFVHLKFYDNSGTPIQGIVQLNGSASNVLPAQTEVFFVCGAGTATITSVGVIFASGVAGNCDVEYASD